jgi:predicted metal-dependent HD superfamily phosphohydrolase
MGQIAAYLRQHWPQVAACYDDATLTALDAAYQEPQRAYHDTSHIIELLEKLETYKHVVDRPDLIVHAIIWHDAVYSTFDMAGETMVHRPDAVNVAASAEWFERTPVAISPQDKTQIAGMVRATSGHDVRLAPNHPHYNDTALFLDLDLSVLALPYFEFAERTMRIRQEYPHLTDQQFFLGRADFLDAYGSKETLFFNASTAAIFDPIARANMQRQAGELRIIAAQKAGGSPTAGP